MRIAHLCTSTNVYPPEGDQGRLWLAYSLFLAQKDQHQLTVFANAKSRLPAPLKLESVPDLKLKGLSLVKKKEMKDLNSDLLTAKAFIQSKQFDIIHSHLNLRHFFFAPFSHCPTVVTQHWPIDANAKLIIKNISQDNVHVVPISQSQIKQGQGLVRYTAVVYNGIDIGKFKFYATPEDHFVFVSRLVREKGAHNAIAAARKAGVNLKIAGKTNTSAKYAPYWQEIKKDIDGKQIIYLGELPHDQVNKAFGQARAFLFPIEWEEPFGLVMAEAMASGTPVIAFRRGAAPELVKDGVTGFIVDNVDQMAEAMKKIGQIDRAACRKHVEDNFTIEKMVAGYEKVYKQITKR